MLDYIPKIGSPGAGRRERVHVEGSELKLMDTKALRTRKSYRELPCQALEVDAGDKDFGIVQSRHSS